MVAKNEEERLGACVESVSGIVDEVIVVVDASTSDGTTQVAEKIGARVLVQEFSDDFSALRNISLREATNEWILVLDADELLDKRYVTAVKELTRIADDDVAGYYFWCHNYFGNGVFNTFQILRLFRNNPAIRFSGIVHETVKPAIDAIRATTRNVNVAIHHLCMGKEGRFPEQSDLYLRLIERQIRLTPEDPKYRLFVALEYVARGKYQQAETICREYVSSHPQSAPMTYFVLAQLYRSLGNYFESIEAVSNALSAFSNARHLVPKEILLNLLGISRFYVNDFTGAIDACKAALELAPCLPQFHLNLATIYECIRSTPEALQHRLAAFELNPFLSDERVYTDCACSNLIQAQLIRPLTKFAV